MYYYVVMLFSTRYVLVAMVVRMECMVCKHTFIRLGNYKRHLAKDHPEITETDIQLRGKHNNNNNNNNNNKTTTTNKQQQ